MISTITSITERDFRLLPLTKAEQQGVDVFAKLQTGFSQLSTVQTRLNSIISTLSGVTVSVPILANDALSTFSVATFNGFLANSSTLAHLGKVAGVVLGSANGGFMATVVVLGYITNASWSWSVGPVYLNNATLSQTAPTGGFVQQIGTARSSDTMFVDPSEPIQL